MNKLFYLLLTLSFSLIANAQNAKDLYESGKKLYGKDKYTEAFAQFELAAKQGHKKAQYHLGRMYSKGKGVKKDSFKATQWYEKAAAQGYAKAQYRLGKCYLKGKGVATDKIKAKELLSKAINDKKNGKEILSEIKKDAKAGDNDAKAILQLIDKQ